MPDAVTLTQSSDDAATSETSDLLRCVVLRWRKFFVPLHYQLQLVSCVMATSIHFLCCKSGPPVTCVFD